MKKSVAATWLRVCQPVLYGLGGLLGSAAYGQPATESVGWPPLQVISVEQGLPQALVSGVVQDDDGFVWVGTLGGLARYDGRQMLSFYHQTDNPDSSANNAVIELKKGEHNQVWLRYRSGAIDRMDTRTGRCRHFTHLATILRTLPPFRYLHVARRENLWGIIHGEGIFRYDVRQDRFTGYGRAATTLVSDTVSALTEDQQGRIRVFRR